jgi:hypothetical protein
VLSVVMLWRCVVVVARCALWFVVERCVHCSLRFVHIAHITHGRLDVDVASGNVLLRTAAYAYGCAACGCVHFVLLIRATQWWWFPPPSFQCPFLIGS